MPRFIGGQDRHPVTRLPESPDEFICDDKAVRAVDAFVDELDLTSLGFDGARPAESGRSVGCSRPTAVIRFAEFGARYLTFGRNGSERLFSTQSRNSTHETRCRKADFQAARS